MGVFFSSFSSEKTWLRENQRLYSSYNLGELRNGRLSFDTDLNRLLQLPIVWNIFCHLLPQYTLVLDDDEYADTFNYYYTLVKIDGSGFSIHIYNDYLYIIFKNFRIGDNIKDIFVETLQKSINIAIKYMSEKRDLNSLALSSKDFIDIEPKPRRSPLRLWKDIERTETAKDEALNIFAHHYYPKVIKNMGKEIGIPIELDIDKNREKPEIRKMNLLFKDQIHKSKLAKYPPI